MMSRADHGDRPKTKKHSLRMRFRKSLLTASCMILCLGFISMALSYTTFESLGNQFIYGSIAVNLNDGKAIVEDGVWMDHGTTLTRDFFLQSEGSGDAYYKIYFTELDGGLARVLQVTLKNKDTSEVLYEGLAKDMTEDQVSAAQDILKAGERKNLEIQFYLPVPEQGERQGTEFCFTLEASAVQVKNNPEREF